MTALSEFYKSQYALEITRKTDLTAALALPAGVLSVLVGALVVMAKELHIPFNTPESLQAASILLSAAACLFSGYFLFRSLFNFAYGYVPTALEVKLYRDKLVAFHQSNGHSRSDAEQLAEVETLEYVDGEYAVNTDRNSKNNDFKSAYLHRANGAIIAAVLAAVVAGGAYVYNSVSSPPPIQKVEFVNIKELKAMTPHASIQAASAPPPPAPPPATRPEPPPSRVIKEDRNPPKPPPPLRK